MPSLITTVEHQLTREEAIDRLQNHAELLRREWGHQISDVTEVWEDHIANFGFKAFGFRITGTVEPRDEDFILNLELPVAAIMLQGAIRQQIEKHLRDILV